MNVSLMFVFSGNFLIRNWSIFVIVSQTSFLRETIVASRNGGCFLRLWNRLFGLDALAILEARKFDSTAGNFIDKN